MNKRKILGLVALGASVVLVVLIVVCMLMAVKFLGVADHLYTHIRTEIDVPIWHISIETNIASVSICTTETENAYIELYDRENAGYHISAENGTLVIESAHLRAWYEQLGVFPQAPEMTLYLPEGIYGNLSIKSSLGRIKVSSRLLFQNVTALTATGDVEFRASAVEEIVLTGSTGRMVVEDLVADTMELWISTGTLTISNVTCTGNLSVGVASGKANVTDTTCRSFLSSGQSGNLSMNNVVARRNFSIDRSTGNVEFNGCDAAGIYVVTGSGNVTGSLLSEKKFEIKTTSGKKDVPATTDGGKCRVTTGSGNVTMSILGDAE